jgi:hypothetical protein
MFNYLVWKRKHPRQFINLFTFEKKLLDLLSLKDTPLPSGSCVLTYTVCKLTSADMFLISVALWSAIELILEGLSLIRIVCRLRKCLIIG